jgi:hypothetical protein
MVRRQCARTLSWPPRKADWPSRVPFYESCSRQQSRRGVDYVDISQKGRKGYHEGEEVLFAHGNVALGLVVLAGHLGDLTVAVLEVYQPGTGGAALRERVCEAV